MDTPERNDARKYDEYDNADVTKDEDLPIDVKSYSAKVKTRIKELQQEQAATLKRRSA